MECRLGCGACCIAPSISSLNKPAGVPCVHLTEDMRCGIFGKPERPKVCADFPALQEHCGTRREEALILLTQLEADTCP
ncbi:YkgJ family cysteine cluster protein [Neptuniibacter sp. CAU 1671]|uniref:YkgJ family cysteine cluster protein n=1 Tax=Neptuniibacter sp. CAU 1671 TaxID=3032593 RepID=UPI0023DADB70|nr:YkgJ family cysteine cluster protein [Neptuniibacter sp. CAU 1671]MDF2182907.1 YkgJ family cysteine cluster protein [Neptuniibacter sp. CAU 1671]